MSVEAAKMLLVIIFAAVGVFSVAAGVAGWPWFYASLNARILTGRMRRRHARIFYVAVGIAIIAMAAYLFVQPVNVASCHQR
ncbi:Imm17 family immunity protein [uncultured Muribaculum sp.]|uniref:Imm17 family immunity protein n=1 Tax=uncultured Muribaculum sp. TaxID=1918613 RepID=UPI0025DB257B|nr:Imm17 family immunity protein [uncultured Muribaculum sp.]